MSDLVTPAYVAAIEAAVRRLDAMRLAAAPLLLFRDAPAGLDPDAEALAPGTATRGEAIRKWRLIEADLGRCVMLNVLRGLPERYGAPAAAGARRVECALRILGPRCGCVLAAGTVARDAAALAVGLSRAPGWNEVVSAGTLRIAAAPHPSGRCRLYNRGGIGRSSHLVVRALIASTR